MTNLPPGVPELSLPKPERLFENDDALICGYLQDHMLAAYALGARRGYEAGLEAAAKVCERIADEYQEREGHRYPELRSDANEGASSCEHAIRQLKGTQ